MLTTSNPSLCKTCNRQSGGKKTFFQNIILSLLLALGLIPGIIYFCLAKTKICHICGLKKSKDYSK